MRLVAELVTQPDKDTIPNKKERKALRQQKAKEKS